MPKSWSLFTLCTALSFGSFSHAQWQSVGNVTSVEKSSNGVELSAGSVRVRLSVVAPNIVRLRYAKNGTFPDDHSFAVLPQAFPDQPTFEVKDASDALLLTTGKLQVRIQKAPLRVIFEDAAGELINQDQPNYPVSFDGTAFSLWKAMPADEHYFALGDKTGPLDHRNLAFTMWNTDMFGWQESTDPLYKDIPFFLGMRRGKAYGIFLDNTYRTSFDFGKQFRNAYGLSSDGGELDYYFFYGPDPKQIVADFTQMTGRLPLPPLFGMGFQQSRYSYFPESQERLQESFANVKSRSTLFISTSITSSRTAHSRWIRTAFPTSILWLRT